MAAELLPRLFLAGFCEADASDIRAIIGGLEKEKSCSVSDQRDRARANRLTKAPVARFHSFGHPNGRLPVSEVPKRP